MLTLPASRPTQPWHQQRSIRKAVLDVFRYCSRKLSYTLLLKPSDDLAWVMPERRLVFITASLPDVQPGVRYDPIDEHGRRSLFLVGFAAHEAGHVRYSGPKPPGSLGELWNALEDERMERLMARDYPELRLARAFTFLGDVVSARAQGKCDGSALEGCLFWRWEHDRLNPRWSVREEDRELWADVRPLVEASWRAKDSEQVTWIARVILDLVRDQQRQGQPQAEDSNNAGDGQQAQDAPGDADGQGQGSGADGARAEAQTPGGDGDQEVGIPDSWNGQVSATGADADTRDGTANPADAEGSDAQDREALERTLEALRGTFGAGREDRPIIPVPDQGDGPGPCAEGVEGYARQLAPLLRPPERAAMPTPHRSRGRFRYDRFAQGAERQFARTTTPNRPQAIVIDQLLDVSSSMKGEPLACAAQAALLLARAASLTSTRVRITAFNVGFQEIVEPGADFKHARQQIFGLEAAGGTRLHTALEHVLRTSPAQPSEVHVVNIICDGELAPNDYETCTKLVKDARARDVRFIPILIGDATGAYLDWQRAFGSAVPCQDLGSLVSTLKATLTALRARIS
ncbi:vWA domain-containing protein [Deinococcus soli (ex Cha et al. 2016)]|uniref:vWA domain-containing protein n=1 Tax=Deinococcus soli (ex Cha et al. 2016) TaxID=1309411 RepID=UPI001665A5B4|nr:VWA domain-containing protein [Deinococcus soli (ex Cha et al. 2016)]